MILVTKPYLPDRSIVEKYINTIYETNWLTNFGPLEHKLTQRLKDYLQVEHLLLLSNGTLALQILYKALGLTGDVVTTPFSFVATTSSLLWENLNPVFADIDPLSFNLSPANIEDVITTNTSAILPVHVFGRSCAVNDIQKIADKNNLQVIYDAAHAFNVTTVENKNILTYGDASILSFHATKLFHTIEGGAIVTNDAELIKECKLLINFGIANYEEITKPGINGKMNEFSAAMGLAVLDSMDYIINERQRVDFTYRKFLPAQIIPKELNFANNNYSYFPVLFDSEGICLNVKDALLANQIMPRRYFYPSLDNLDYINKQQYCPVSRDISSRILCLPMYDSLTELELLKICHVVSNAL